MTFQDLKIGDRFSSKSFPQGRLYQKLSNAYAADLSDGPGKDGSYLKDIFPQMYEVVLRNEGTVMASIQRTIRGI